MRSCVDPVAMKRRCGAASADDNETFVSYVAPATLYYRGEIKEPHVTKFVRKLREASDARREASSSQPNVVYLSSHGGCVYGGITMYEHVRMVAATTPVHTVVDGFCASAATLPFLAGTQRTVCESATMLVHAVSSSMWGGWKPRELREESENLDTLMELLTAIYARHSSAKPKALRKLLEKDKLLTRADCHELGFVNAQSDDTRQQKPVRGSGR